MTNRNIEQIRDLLLGEFIHEFDQRMTQVEEKIDEIEQNNTKSTKQLAQHLHKKLEEFSQNQHRQYEYLEERISKQMKEQKSFSVMQSQSLKGEIAKERDALSENIKLVKSRFERALQVLQKDYRSKMVSKQSLAGVLFEQSLRLKGDSIEKSLKSEISKKKP